MPRYSAADIPLPRLQAAGAMALGEQLLTAAAVEKKQHGLPKALTKSHAALGRAHDALSSALLVEPAAGSNAEAVAWS